MPINQIQKLIEVNNADKYRAQVADFMCKHSHQYSFLPIDVVNGDLPAGAKRYKSMFQRMTDMKKPGNAAVSNILKRPIIVLDQETKKPLYVQYTAEVADVGHYDCVMVSSLTGENNSFTNFFV